MTPEAMRLKSRLKNQAASSGLTAQALLQSFMLERLLERLSRSDFRARLILKGGVLLMGLLGVRRRTTMDMDATLRGIPLTEENVLRLLREVCSVSLPDRTSFDVLDAGPIRKDDRYGGFRIRLVAIYETIRTPLTVDISAGDAITPGPVEHILHGQFGDGAEYRILGYPVESVLAEKSESILALGEFGTRPRDWYDVHAIVSSVPFDRALFVAALSATAAHRGTEAIVADATGILETLSRSALQRRQWEQYRRRFAYAKDIEFNAVLDSLRQLLIPAK